MSNYLMFYVSICLKKEIIFVKRTYMIKAFNIIIIVVGYEWELMITMFINNHPNC